MSNQTNKKKKKKLYVSEADKILKEGIITTNLSLIRLSDTISSVLKGMEILEEQMQNLEWQIQELKLELEELKHGKNDAAEMGAN